VYCFGYYIIDRTYGYRTVIPFWDDGHWAFYK
jgi:hypothetical protein